jgi:chemotaxis protein histidine kinase CheA
MDSNERDGTGPDSPDSPEWVDPWSWHAYPEPPAEPDQSAEDEPAEAQPAEDEPAEAEPAEDEPAGDESAEDEPAADEPAADEPAEDEPAADEPAEDEPAEGEPAPATPSDEEDDATVEMAPLDISDPEPSEAGEAIQLPDLDPRDDEEAADPDAEPPDDTEAAEAEEPEGVVDSAPDPDAEAALGEEEQEERDEPTDWAERVRLLEDVEAAPLVPSPIDDLWQPQDPAPDPDVAGTTQPLPPVPVARPSGPPGPPPPMVVLVPPPLTATPVEQPTESPALAPPARRPAIRVVPPTPPEPAIPQEAATPPPEPPGALAPKVETAPPPPEPLAPEPPGPLEPRAAPSAPPAPTPWLLPVDPVAPGWLPEPATPPPAPPSPPPPPLARPGLPPPPGSSAEAPFPPLRLPEPPRDRGPRPLPPSRGGTGAPTPPILPPPPWAGQRAGWNRPGAPPAPWGLPPTPPSRRTSTRRTWVIAVAVLAALAVASFQLVSLVRSGREETATTRRAPAARPGQTGTSASPLTPEQQVTRLLAARSNALLRHDKAAFLATVDSQRKSFYHAQAVLFDRMATVPFSSFTYAVPNPLKDLGTEGSRQRYSPAMVFTYPVEASYQFKGQDTNPLLARFYYTFEVTRAGWRIAGQDDVKAPLRSDVEIWDAGAVRTLSTARTLVVFHPGDGAMARRLLTVAERGYAQVAASWSSSWDQRVVILLPADQKEAQRLVRTRDLSDVAAVTSSAIEAGPAHRLLGNRIIVNTNLIAGYRTLDLQVVMTHEMTHVATRKVGVGVPLYLVEGFADYTALRPLAAPLRITRPSLASAVRANRFKGKLPSRSQLVGAGAALAYDEGSSFCLWVATSFGEAKLQALYRSFGDLDTDPTRQDEDVRFRHVLGISRATAESRWAAFVKEAV